MRGADVEKRPHAAGDAMLDMRVPEEDLDSVISRSNVPIACWKDTIAVGEGQLRPSQAKLALHFAFGESLAVGKGLLRIGKRDHQRHGINRRGLKSAALVKPLRILRNRMNQDCSDPRDISRLHCA